MTLVYRELGSVGRLGNQLWQVASTIGLAQGLGEEARFPLWEYAPFFSVPDEYFVEPSQLAGRDASELLTYMDAHSRLFMQDYKLIAPVEETIRAFFRPSERARLELEKVEWFHALPRPRLALHVRRGDLLYQDPVTSSLRSIDYYRRAAALHPDDEIVVFSDDIRWCRAHLPAVLPGRKLSFYDGVPRPHERSRSYRSSPVLDWVDLQLMALCEDHVTSNSTLAWWGAYLSANPVPIYPSNWFAAAGPGRPDAALMFPPSWREVDDPTQPLPSKPLWVHLRKVWWTTRWQLRRFSRQ